MLRPTAILSATALALLPAGAGAQAAVKTADYSFDYSYPAAAGAIPALRSWLERDRAGQRARVAKESAQDRREAKNGSFPYRPHEATTQWKVVTQTPRLLSLSGQRYQYTGGAHGGTATLSLVWDKEKRRILPPAELFSSPAAVQAALGARFCDALDRERAKRRGEKIVRGADPFSDCVKVSDTTLLFGSTDGRAIDRLGLVADAYVAGPYAEGAYEVTLPVTPALVATVRPEYRALFAAR